MKQFYGYGAMYLVVLIHFGVISQESGKCEQPDFLASMRSWKEFAQFDNQDLLDDPNMALAIKSYNDFWGNGVQYSNEPLIPKIIHQIWLGSPLPEKYKNFQQSWKKYHPDWTYILWTEKEIEEFGLTNKKLYDSIKNYSPKSDIVRYEVLYRMGGLYVDTDFECLKPFDILHHCLEFYTSCLPASKGEWHKCLLCGLIGARPGHPILKACIDGLKDAYDTGDYMTLAGPHYFSKIVFKNLSSEYKRAVIFPASFFYPLPNHFAKHCVGQEELKKRFVHDESFAIHWWACSWMK